MTTLHGETIRRRRIEARLSTSTAADFLGVNKVVFRRIEAGDTAAVRQVTVPGLIHLADALGCRPQDLFTTPNTAHDSRTDVGATALAEDTPPGTVDIDPATASTAASTLAGYLLASRIQVSVRDIARALKWTRKEVHAAKVALAPLLEGTGIALAVRADMLQLVPDEYATAYEAVQVATKAKTDRRGINDGVARVLTRVLDGSLGPSGHHSVFTRSAVSTLTSLGALDSNAGRPRPSAALLYALDRLPHQHA
ncbi:unannotated protein [freshwater metagenome]|uniref:Unannotated protein n=1 Tax=freshwater metagenome TaxID=449393 RepID=A0A6J6V732_9ZZZZ|nr:hypothetical protein [Actinomycetota bacterium]